MNNYRHVHFSNWSAVCKALNVETEAEAKIILESEDNQFYYDVCYIKNAEQIYTHGKIYYCSKYDDSEIINLLSEKADLEHTHSYQDLIADSPNKVLVSDETNFVLKDIQELIGVTNTSRQLKFYCVEPVTVTVNNVSQNFQANSFVNIYFTDNDIFEVTPSSENSILTLDAWPGALNVFYPWLEGVQSFNNIIFNMNPEDMYVKWNQGHQGQYHVQMAQYNNCVFWSDRPYISDVNLRTNYTLYQSAHLPLCYSTIPENTFKAFYCAYGVKFDPNWANDAYKNSFALATHATQVFSYYGAQTIGIFNMDSSLFNIPLPKDCRGLMFYSANIENAGVFDATNTTNFGAKRGSWSEAFGSCSNLSTLYIKNLKASINVSWSPINIESLSFIINNAANTTRITISLSPYTWNRLTEDVKTAAASKNILLELISTNYIEDKRWSDTLNKSAQNLSDAEILQVHENLDLTWGEYD